MNILIIGNGGREHALAYKIKESSLCEKLFVIPGNGGTVEIAETSDIELNDFEQVYSFCLINKIDLVVIGPEQYLVNGITDFLRGRNIKVFGPTKNAARIESEKSYAKELMKKYTIPTAQFKIFSKDEYKECLNYLGTISSPFVIKADGIAAGKGVLILDDLIEAQNIIKNIFLDKIFGESGNKVVIEEYLNGIEASIFAITDGEDFVCLPTAQDHKRIGDNDTGKNTGGMGAYSPTPFITNELLEEIKTTIIIPTLTALKKEGNPFVGCLYCGLMITKQGPKVIEFNCRFGDPETQAVMPILEGDFLKLLYSSAIGKIDKEAVRWNGKSAVCVVCASKGYPDHFEKGFEIKGLEQLNEKDIFVFHAGTKRLGDKIITNGGRVLGITAIADSNNLKEAIEKVYEKINVINFDNIYYRKDIGKKGLEYNSI
ncbi:MAG: phosphoribosylamine--glycine ligase [Ignavibacterium sp.]